MPPINPHEQKQKLRVSGAVCTERRTYRSNREVRGIISSIDSTQKRLSRKTKRGKNYEKARIKVAKQHNHIAFKRTDYQFKLAHKLCDMADTIYVEDCDFRIMAKGMLGKHTIDASFGQLRTILEYVAKKRDVFVGRVDHRGTSQTCPNCRSSVKKDISIRLHECQECGYVVDRDIASGQEICNRGIETYRGTPEKQEIDERPPKGVQQSLMGETPKTALLHRVGARRKGTRSSWLSKGAGGRMHSPL